MQKLSQQEIASRLTLNTQSCDLASWSLALPDDKITFIDSHAATSLPDSLREQLYSRHPNAKQAMIKSGGDFPFLSRHDEVTMYLQVHLRANGAFIVS
ncbi:hypothetical protein PINS_up002894 [Pythium insidiosum]|nr:hypothetical protein PINS_up002894 [Pythium insidiosum]